MEKLVDQLCYDDLFEDHAGKLSIYNELLDAEHHKIFANKKSGEFAVLRYVVKQTTISKLALSLYNIGVCDFRFSFKSTAEIVFRSQLFNEVEEYVSNITLHIKRNGATYRTTSIKRMNEERIKALREINELVELSQGQSHNIRNSHQAIIGSSNNSPN